MREEGYSAGQVMNVIFAAIIGGFSLGQAGPNFGTFATGRTAGYRVFSVIDRKPAIDLADKGIVPTKDMQVQILLPHPAVCLAAALVCNATPCMGQCMGANSAQSHSVHGCNAMSCSVTGICLQCGRPRKLRLIG